MKLFKHQLHRIVAFISVVIPMLVNAQQEIPGNSVDWNMINSATGLYTVSPQAAEMGKYGTYPVNKATGIPEVSIPIYTIKSGLLEFPITLSYHMGGIQVQEIPSWVGLGWSLNANGIINRTIRGIADERTDKTGWLNGSSDGWPYSIDNYWSGVNSMGGAENLISIFYNSIDNLLDKASDIYQYSVNGVAGRFVYDFDRQLVQTPLTDNKIARDRNNNFTITDAKGIQYKFFAEDVELSQNLNEYGSRLSPVTWQVSEIISPDRVDTLRFSYSAEKRYEENHRSFSLTRGKPFQLKSSGYSPMSRDVVAINGTESATVSTEKLLSAIKFRGGKVVFKKESRSDMRKECLSEIIVYDAYNMRVKRIQFKYGYFDAGTLPAKKENLRLKLQKILISGRDDSDVQVYTFSYNEDVKLPSYDQYQNNWYGQDYWGYYNGITTNKSLLVTNYAGTYQADREPREYAMKAYILTRIDYPTGGFTVFETEANRVTKNNSEKIIGGLRIARISSYTDGADASPHVISYLYEGGAQIYAPTPEQYEMSAAFSYENAPGGIPNGADIFAYDTEEPSAPAMVYMEYPMSLPGRYQGSPIIYRKVTEMQGYYQNIYTSKDIITEGKTVYTYDTPELLTGSLYSYTPSDLSVTSAIPIDWLNGYLKKVDIYRKNSWGWNTLKSVEYEYAKSKQEFWSGTYISDRVIYQGLCDNLIPEHRINVALCYFNHLWFRDVTGWHHLVRTTETDYLNMGENGTITNYKYGYMNVSDPTKRNMMVSEIEKYDLKNNLINCVKYTYAHQDDPNMSEIMTGYNMLAYPYEEHVYDSNMNTVLISRQNYASYTGLSYSPMIKPLSVSKCYSTSANSRTEVEYLKYDKWGNPLEVKEKNGIHTVYLWAYCGQYPIAEIKNASYSQIASILGADTIEQNMNTIEPESGYLTMINKLRNNEQLKGAHVTTYKFKPPYGMIESRDQSGRTTFYEYNSWGALYKIKDENENPLQEFYYNHKN